MDYWERKDRKTQLDSLNKRNYASGGTVDKEVGPGIFSPMQAGETVRKDENGNRIYTPPEPQNTAPKTGKFAGGIQNNNWSPDQNIINGIQTN